MKRVIAFLQNAWSPLYAGGTWPRKSWLKALDKSRSGQRLRVLTGSAHPVEIVWENTTPIVGATPDSIILHLWRPQTQAEIDADLAQWEAAGEPWPAGFPKVSAGQIPLPPNIAVGIKELGTIV
jgi:hypothetical protein